MQGTRILTPRLHKAVTESLILSKPAKVYFFQWAQKWYYSNIQQEGSAKADLPSLICVLQAIGFKLRKFEKKEQTDNEEEEVKDGNVRITMECGSSKMTALLEMDNIECQCPDTSEANGATLWSVTATAPMDTSRSNEETGSNLLPDLPKSTVEVVRDVTLRLFNIINSKAEDIRESISSNLDGSISQASTPTAKNLSVKPLVRSYTDVYKEVSQENSIKEINKSIAQYLQRIKGTSTTPKSTPRTIPRTTLLANAKKQTESTERPKLYRQNTYEMERPSKTEDSTEEQPRSTPTRVPSPPLPLTPLSDSISRLSLQSEDDWGLEDYVFRAYRSLDAAVKHILASAPATASSNLSLTGQDDSGNFTRPTCPSRMSSSFSSPLSSTSSLTSASVSRAASQASSTCKASATRTSQQRSSLAATTTATHRYTATSGLSTGRTTDSLPLARDRSSSFSAAQRPAISKSLQQPPGPARRNTSLSLSTSGIGNGIEKSTSAIGQRSTPTGLKPPSSNITQQRNSTGTNATRLSRRQSSPNTSSISVSSNAKTSQQQQRANASLIKPPGSRYSIGNSSISSLNSSKFGFGLSKK